MTNSDMVKRPSPAQAARAREGLSGDDAPENAAPERARIQPGTPSQPVQFPIDEDPLDSNQLKPMIDQKHGPGLKAPLDHDR